MLPTNKIASELPYLRRFARALTGSQASGDAYVVAALEAVRAGAESDLMGAAMSDRQALFAILLRIWTSTTTPSRLGSPEPKTQIAAADRTLEAVTPLPRVAFLLRALEGFSQPEIARMLAKTPTEVEALLTQAGREIANQLSTDVLIIEDEPVIAMDLEALVTDLGHRVIKIARTHKEAVAAITLEKPGLVLADIQLADGSSGLAAVNEILAACTASVIFITAYPERLLTGERPEPAFLITKPFRQENVMAIISQALFFNRVADAPARRV